MSAPVDVLAVMDTQITWTLQHGGYPGVGSLREARAAVAELIAADREHDDARRAFAALNRRIAENGWLDIEFDALRKAGARFVSAQMRRGDALARVGSVP